MSHVLVTRNEVCVGHTARRGDSELIDRNKHKNHWKTFDRKSPPKWMKLGEVGIDDKRTSSHSSTCHLTGFCRPAGNMVSTADLQRTCTSNPGSMSSQLPEPQDGPTRAQLTSSSFVVEVKGSEIVPAGKSASLSTKLRFESMS